MFWQAWHAFELERGGRTPASAAAIRANANAKLTSISSLDEQERKTLEQSAVVYRQAVSRVLDEVDARY
ncbi:hypothetical protein [Aeromicrobium massiliense]|uniref:hypothetical protein n=1 Tax=Aeromicrobium massiliense TaxID=1464554 RepID=UPI0005786FCD|nr:hypothetical protein [Aeromicrobium massiliense]